MPTLLTNAGGNAGDLGVGRLHRACTMVLGDVDALSADDIDVLDAEQAEEGAEIGIDEIFFRPPMEATAGVGDDDLAAAREPFGPLLGITECLAGNGDRGRSRP